MNTPFANYITRLPKSAAELVERAYIARRAPALAELYLRDRRVLADALDGVASSLRAERPLPADMPLISALAAALGNHHDAGLGPELRRAIAWYVAEKADTDASDEASELYDHMRTLK